MLFITRKYLQCLPLTTAHQCANSRTGGYPTEPALSVAKPNFLHAIIIPVHLNPPLAPPPTHHPPTTTVTTQTPPPPSKAPASPIITSKTTTTRSPPQSQTAMSFLGFGKPQPTLAEKMAAAEQELEMITDMFNRFFLPSVLPSFSKPVIYFYIYFSHNNLNLNAHTQAHPIMPQQMHPNRLQRGGPE